MIDLQRMINPLGPSLKAVETIKNNLADIHKYIGPLKVLIEKIAQLNGVKEDQVLLSDGADGALTLIAQSVFKGKHIVIPQPCFHRYKDYPLYLGIDYTLINPKNSIFLDENIILQSKGDILLLASPNNPTGFIISDDFLEKVLRKFEVVILDETLLLSFEGKQSYIAKYQNLIIVRSFSKLGGLAGLRIGYIIATSEYIFKIKSVSTPFKVNYLGQIASLAILDDHEYREKTKLFIESQRKLLYDKLQDNNIQKSKSLCYCLFLTSEQQQKLKQKRILVQEDMGFGYNLNNEFLFRIIIGPEENNKALISALKG